MKKGVQKLWAELSKAQKPAKLSKQGKEVKLSVVDELEDLYSQLEEATSNASYFAYDMVPEMDDKVRKAVDGLDDMLLNSNISDLRDIANEAKGLLDKLQSNAEDLGVDVEDIYADYQEMREWADGADDLAYDVAREFESSLLRDLTAFADRVKY